MSNLDLMMFEISMPIYPNFHILNSNKTPYGCKRTVMIPIDEKEEELIDNIGDEVLKFNRGNRTFSIKRKNVYCYGEVDFKDKDTFDAINKFKFLNHLGGTGIPIYANYNYIKHVCRSFNKHCLWTETWSPAELARYAHGYLGKPQRILLFNEITK